MRSYFRRCPAPLGSEHAPLGSEHAPLGSEHAPPPVVSPVETMSHAIQAAPPRSWRELPPTAGAIAWGP